MYQMIELNKAIHIEGIYTFFYFEHGNDFNYVGEKHDFWELVYVDSGELLAVAEDKTFLLSQGSIIFHKPMEFHGMTSVNGKPHNVLITSFEIKSEAMDFFKEKIINVNSKQKKILTAYLEEMRKTFGKRCAFKSTKPVLTNEQKLSYQTAISYLELFLIELVRESTPASKKEKGKQFSKKNVENVLVASIKEYLQDNVYNSISLNDVCRNFNMSKSYISQVFKNETGKSIIDYYINLKITEAKFLIREGRYNFTQISEKLGYSSLHHFTRIFKNKEKMSPSLYEKSIK